MRSAILGFVIGIALLQMQAALQSSEMHLGLLAVACVLLLIAGLLVWVCAGCCGSVCWSWPVLAAALPGAVCLRNIISTMNCPRPGRGAILPWSVRWKVCLIVMNAVFALIFRSKKLLLKAS